MADSENILISCPECQAAYELSAADCGEAVECGCGCQFVVPAAVLPDAAPPAQVMVLCPSCASVYQLEPAALGDNVECQCGTIFEATEATLPDEEPAPAAATMIRTLCPMCSAEYELEAESVGQVVECGCGNQFVVTAATAPAPDNVPSAEVNEAESVSNVAPDSTTSTPSPDNADTEPPAKQDMQEGPSGEDAPPAAADSPRAPSPATPPSQPKSRPEKKNRPAKRTSNGKKSTASLMIMGGCAVAAVGVLLVFLFSDGDSSSKSGKESGTNVARQKKRTKDSQQGVAALDRNSSESAATSIAAEEKRPSLAERLEQARHGKENGDQTTGADAGGSQPGNTASQKMTAAVGSGNSPANPNALTNKQDFVIGGPPAGSKPGVSQPSTQQNKTDRASGTKPPAEASPTTSKVAAASAGSASESNGDRPAAKSTAVTPPQKRIDFVPPKRRYRRFKDAATAGFKQFASMRQKKAAVASGKKADTEAWETELADTGGLLKSALQLVDAESDPKRVLQARLVMAFCYLEAGQVYEAGILAHALARWTPADLIIEPEAKKGSESEKGKPNKPAGQALSAGEAILAAENAAAAAAKKEAATASVDPAAPMQPAVEAATLALAAFLQAHDAAPDDDRDADFNQILEVAELFESKFPDHKKVDSIRLYVGQLHQIRDDKVGAAEWYARVSKASPEFARSRLQAGQTLWSSYLTAVQQAAESATTDPTTAGATALSPAQLKKRAQQYLTSGVEAGAGNAALRKNVIVAKLTLAQLHLGEDRFEETVAALTAGEPSVTSAVGEGSEGRPTVGVRSVEFAKIAYTTLIRAHLGTNQLEAARDAMATLQEIAGAEDSAALAKLHLDLSAEMTASYKELAATGQEDIELLTTIATLLEQVVAHGEGLSLASLLKAATTATDLADSVSVPEDAQLIYGQAASLYQAILNAELPDADNEKAIRFRLAAAFSKARRFEESLQLYRELLVEQPNIFDAQFAAASAMQAWGEDLKEPNQLARAITGDSAHPSIWGWAKLSQTYQRLLANDESRDDYRDRFLETRLHIAECRLAYARQLSGSKNAKKKTAELEKSMRELATLSRTNSSYDAPAWPLLNTIYRDIQKELGRTPEPLFDTTNVTSKTSG